MPVVVNDGLVRNAGSGFSTWLAAATPITLKLLRRDYEVSIVNFNSPTTLIVYLVGAITPTDFPAGAKIYLKSGTNDGVYTVVSFILPASAVIVQRKGIDLPSSGGYLNTFERKNYYIDLRANYGTTGDMRDFKISPQPNGAIDIDLRGYIASKIGLEDDVSFGGNINARDEIATAFCALQYRERWLRFTGNYVNVLPGTFTYSFSNTALQIGELYDGNMVEYVPFNNSNSRAKFLRPGSIRFWQGYPFDVSFIYPIELFTIPLLRREELHLYNGSTVVNFTQLNPNRAGWVNRLRLAGNYDGVMHVDLSLWTPDQGQGRANSYADGYSEEYTEQIVKFGSVLQQVSETKRIMLGTCEDYPVYLGWRNTLGGMSYWLFGGRQGVDLNVDRPQLFQPPVSSVSQVRANQKVVTKKSRNEWVLGGVWTQEEAKGNEDLFTSPYVICYFPGAFREVIVEVGSYRIYDTREAKQEFEFTISFPEKYNQRR